MGGFGDFTPYGAISETVMSEMGQGQGGYFKGGVAVYESKLEEGTDGACLTCFYNPKLRNWDEAIAQALLKHKLESGEVTIVCIPKEKE